MHKSDNAFIGLVGLNQADDLPVASWDKGYATETAIAVLYFAFSILEEDWVTAFATV